MKVVMAVISDMTHDARVYREARTLVEAGWDVTVLSTAKAARQYTQDGIRIVALPLDVAGRSGLGAFYLNLLRELLARPADVYHAHNVHTLPVCWWAARRRRARLVYDSHELFTALQLAEPSRRERIKQFIERKAEWLWVRAADAVVTVSNAYADILVRLYGIERPVVLQNVSPLQPLERGTGVIRRRLGLRPDQVVVLYQGGYYLVTRALDKLILAFHHLPARYVLVYIGFSVRGEEESLQELVQREGLAERVHFLPPVPHQELVAYTMDADVGVIPFIDNCDAMHWCTPNKVYEYLMAGLATVCTDLPELRRVVEGHRVGVLMDPLDPRSTAAAIRSVADDPQALAAMQARARAAAEAEYNGGGEQGKLVGLYAGLWQRRRA